MAEHQLPKLNTRVRFPSSALGADEHAAIEWTHLEPDEVLVAVCARDRSQQVVDTMREHGGDVRYVPRLDE